MEAKKTLLEALTGYKKLTDEEYEPYKHYFKVYVSSGGKITEYCINRKDFEKDFNGEIIIPKIYEKTPVRKYKLFESYDEAFVDSYQNYYTNMINKYKRELKDLEKFTEQYTKIIEEKPHLGV